ncbi:hypothetical protein CPAR01_01846 [Colletotrichum paranaense]|uniref:Cytochrome P450 n=1 Tax=Colletotrichum paranaense TaxID=1914294 RepID=A0ABQ9T7W4_9PEZI|nr:uncharacterized protein CPAR01_01846 [Colletotrichum paranaense]KAK1547879.1 hypothetical protein CPAR01_01846 [Colletotrichum paranaense]
MTQHSTWFDWLSVKREMDVMPTILSCISARAMAIIATLFYRLILHPLSHLPGPLPARLTGLWRTTKYIQGDWHDDILSIHDKYGRVVRIAPNEVSVVDEYAMKNLYGHGHNAAKTDWYSIWDSPITAPQSFSELDQKQHSFLRKHLASAYSMSSVLNCEVHIQACLDLLIRKLEKYTQAGETVDMAVRTNAFAFDVVGELDYGSQFGHLQEEKDKRLDDPKMTGREDLLAYFCRMKDLEGKLASFVEILVEAMNLVGARADTISISMRTCLFYLAANSGVLAKLREEIDNFYNVNTLKAPISHLETQKLPYLQAVIKEAIRLLPSIVFQLPRHTPPDFKVRGIKIPVNTMIGISPIAQNRDQEIWGSDANEFPPGRWLENEDKTRYFDRSTMTFGGSGPRMCMGRNIAPVELHKFVAQFVHIFDFKLVNTDAPWRIKAYCTAYQSEVFRNISRRK